MPEVLNKFNVFKVESINKLKSMANKMGNYSQQDIEEAIATVTGEFRVYECTTLTEFAREAELDDCWKQVIVDPKTGRYYLCALTIDPGRAKATIEDGIVVQDTKPRPARCLYFLEVSTGEFKLWQRSDYNQRRAWWDHKLEMERAEGNS